MPEQQAPAVTLEATINVPPQSAPDVLVTNEVHPAAISEVRIVAMPERETITTPARDKSGNITSTVQTEKDKE